MHRIVLPNEIDLVVVSYGGVGTTFLIKFLEQYRKTNNPYDADGFKHSPLPPISFNPNLKFIYVYGNPQMAAVSLFRRGFHAAQSMKLQSQGKRKTPIPVEMTLEKYASLGIDLFGFENHFHNWYDKYIRGTPTLFIRYEAIFDNIEHLLEFADIPMSTIDTFPKKKRRRSTKEEIPEDIRKRLDHIYGGFADELEKLDDIEIRRDGNSRLFSMKYMDIHYGIALAEQAIFETKCLLRGHAPKTFAFLKRIKQLTRRST